MFFTKALFALALAATSVLAQSPYPTCTAKCFENLNLQGCKSQADLGCLCRSEPFITSTTACFQANCSGDDLTTAVGVSQAACKSAGVDLSSSSIAAPSGSAASTASAPSGTITRPASSAPVTGAPSGTSGGPGPSSSTPPNAASPFAFPGSISTLAGIAAFVGLVL